MKGIHRRAARRDASEAAIVDALRACGFSVESLSKKGCGDLLLGKHGITRVVEVKSGTESLNDEQRLWWGKWRGNGLIVLRSVEDVARLAALWDGRGVLDLLSRQ